MPYNENGEFRLDHEEKFIERVKKWDHHKLMNKIIYADFLEKAIAEGKKDGDPRAERQAPIVKRQREIVHAEIQRRKAAGEYIPDVKIQAQSVQLGSSAKIG